MGNIPHNVGRKVMPSGRVGDVPVPYDIADTGAGIEAQGTANLGKGISDLGEALYKIGQVEGVSQADTARGQANARMKQLEADLKYNNDPDTYRDELDKAMTDISTYAPKNKFGAKLFGDFVKSEREGWSSGVNILQLRKRKELIEGAYIADYEVAIQSRNVDEAIRLTENARDVTGVISVKEATNAIIEAPILVAKGQIQDSLNDADKAMSEGNFIAASISVAKAELMANKATELPADIERNIRNRINSAKASMKKLGNDALEKQQEADRDALNDALNAGTINYDMIDGTSLDEKEQRQYWQWAKAEADRAGRGAGIETNPQIRNELHRDIMGILQGSKTRREVIQSAMDARYGKNPTLSQPDYEKFTAAVYAQYEQAYSQATAKVRDYAEGLLLQTDSLGIIKNAPIRQKILGDFTEKWLQWSAEKGDKLKISEIYPEGRKLAAMFQISDEEAERQEREMSKGLKQKESGLQEPETLDEFKKTVRDIGDEAEARAYYDKWVNKWQ